MSAIKQNYINHIALVLDASGSMQPLRDQVIKVADNQIEHLARRSKELDQETRITVYTFSDSRNIQCLVYDKDVLRMPSLKGLYHPDGGTALIDATLKALDDLSKTPELYGDHAFLAYVLTDGEENASRSGSGTLSATIKALKDNWTLAAFVPNANGKYEAKKLGFPADNIAIWDTTAKGMSEVGDQIRKATDNFMTSRATGVRGYKTLFNMEAAVASISSADVKKLSKLHPGQYRVAEIKADSQIAPFVEKFTGRAYKIGEAFYQLTKPEKVQADKVLALMDKKSKYLYTGENARKVLGLPDTEVKVTPAQHADFDIYIQSGSVNRKLIAGTRLLLVSN
jgi:hypothetical protein